MLKRYGIFAKLGAFPVTLDSRRGGAEFLSASRAIMAQPDAVLWITAQGRFADARARPLALRPGVAHLAEVAPEALFVPLALDYAFWDERGPEAFCAFGEPIPGRDLARLPRAERLPFLEAALTRTLDALADEVIARDPGRFDALIEGRRGIGGLYDGWRRLTAWLAGKSFDPAHRSSGSLPHPEVPKRSEGLEGDFQLPLRPLETSFEAAGAAPQDEGVDGIERAAATAFDVTPIRGVDRGR